MNAAKTFLLILTFAMLTACSTLESLVAQNNTLTKLAISQATARYIAAGDTIAAEKERAENIKQVALKIKESAESFGNYKEGQLINLIKKQVKLDSLDIADRALISELVNIIELDISYDSSTLEASEQANIYAIIDNIVDTANLYLEW